MKPRTLSQLKTSKGMRILVRVDFNVPVGAKGKIDKDGDERIKAALPTIIRLRKAGAKLILVSHLGRPDGRQKKYSLAPVAKHLGYLLGAAVSFIDDRIDDDEKVEKKLAALRNGGVAMLENIRFYKGEEQNSVFLARRLASLADVFVDDAFAVAHRSHASNVGVAKLLPSYAGLLFEKEVENLGAVLGKPKRPFAVLLGGAKISTKLPTLKHLLEIADAVFVGGGLANTFFRARGYSTGKSLVSPADVRLAKSLLKKKKLSLPVDLLVADNLTERADVRVCAPDDVKRNEYVVDVGPRTVLSWALELKKAKTIVWNGPVGLFEVKKFSHGSVSLGRVIAARSSGKSYGVVGGGETVQCLERTGMAEYVDHVSTGGGAMLDFLAGKPLPALHALMK